MFASYWSVTSRYFCKYKRSNISRRRRKNSDKFSRSISSLVETNSTSNDSRRFRSIEISSKTIKRWLFISNNRRRRWQQYKNQLTSYTNRWTTRTSSLCLSTSTSNRYNHNHNNNSNYELIREFTTIIKQSSFETCPTTISSFYILRHNQRVYVAMEQFETTRCKAYSEFISNICSSIIDTHFYFLNFAFVHFATLLSTCRWT